MVYNEELKSFHFVENIQGRAYNFLITQNEFSYSIEQDGVVIGEIQWDEPWKQISGGALSPKIIELVGDKIEANFW